MQDIYNRALFAGNPTTMPQAPSMMPQAADKQKGAENMAAMAGLQGIATQMQDMYNEIDEAENIEDVINTVRGDKKPISARRDELANLVGKADAKKTPESVLAVMQPLFTIMEVMQQQAPEGGIKNAPMNIMQGDM